MKIDTAGNQIIEPIQNCDCGLTAGCKKCKLLPSSIGCISDEEADEIKRKCKNCGDDLDNFCSRYCRIEFTPPN